MKTRAIFLFIIFLILCSIIISKEQRQKTEWKGKIEIEDGVKVVKNPGEPLYGEITFELEEDLSIGREGDNNYMFYSLVTATVDSEDNIFVLDMGNCRIQKYDKNGEYLQTIGRQGQGPGEFQMPKFIRPYIHLDFDETLYVLESTRIHAFDRKGNFKKVIKLSMNISFPFGIADEGNILAKATSRKQEKFTCDIVLISSEEKRIKTIACYTVHSAPRIGGRILLGNPYAPRLTFCPLSKGRGVYGYSQEYRLFIINSSGETEHIIEKDDPQLPITKKEKDKLVDRYMESQRRSKKGTILSKSEVERGYVFPKNKPFYTRIFRDDKDRIYVLRFKSPFDEENSKIYDLFNKEGYYLYKVTIPSIPIYAIKNGRIYSVRFEKDTDITRIIRYKIKNWDRIKEGT